MALRPDQLAVLERAKRFAITLDRPEFRDPPLPEWLTALRPHQVTAIKQIQDAFTRVNVVVMEAPTGSGKSIIAELSRRLQGSPGIYLCTTKTLQDQIIRDFAYAKVLKGRSNYPTELWPEETTCDDCTSGDGDGCLWCMDKSSCPYTIAKSEALEAPLAVLNVAYFLAEANSSGLFSQGNQRKGEQGKFIILDEADTLEDELMNYVNVEISASRLKKYGWDVPDKVTVQASWVAWLESKVTAVDRRLRDTNTKLKDDKSDLQLIREKRYLARLKSNMETIISDLRFKDDLLSDKSNVIERPWVYAGTNRAAEHPSASFKPVVVDTFGGDVFWKNCTKVLVMSATIMDARALLVSTGFQVEDENGGPTYEVIPAIKSTFPVENRPIYVAPVGSMSRNRIEESTPKMVDAIKAIIWQHEYERVLIHTVNYALSKNIAQALDGCGRAVYTYSSADERSTALANYLASPSAILVAPSMDRGYDFPDDACRVQIVAKIPFPNLNDRQISTRLHMQGGSLWYLLRTVRTLIQMTGRGVRSETDHATTYILDADFVTNILPKSRHLMPSWWKDALIFEKPSFLDTVSL